MRLSEPEAGPEGKEGLGEIFRTHVHTIMDSLVI
jgi:hypothetical protein